MIDQPIDEKLLEPREGGVQPLDPAQVRLDERGRFPVGVSPLRFDAGEHLLGPVAAKGVGGKECGHLRAEVFLTDVWLGASGSSRRPLRAAIVEVALLRLGGHGVSALPAPEEAAKGDRPGCGFPERHPDAAPPHLLHPVEQPSRYDRLVGALVDLPAPPEVAIVNRVREDDRYPVPLDELVVLPPRKDPVRGEELAEGVVGLPAGGVAGEEGSILAFRVGHRDAEALQGAFGGGVSAEDLASLGNGEVIGRVLTDGRSGQPFRGRTFPPSGAGHGRRDAIIRRSRERYATARAIVEERIARWMRRK